MDIRMPGMDGLERPAGSPPIHDSVIQVIVLTTSTWTSSFRGRSRRRERVPSIRATGLIDAVRTVAAG